MNPAGRPTILKGEKTMVSTTLLKKDKSRIGTLTKNQSEFIRDAILEKLTKDEKKKSS